MEHAGLAGSRGSSAPSFPIEFAMIAKRSRCATRQRLLERANRAANIWTWNSDFEKRDPDDAGSSFDLQDRVRVMALDNPTREASSAHAGTHPVVHDSGYICRLRPAADVIYKLINPMPHVADGT